MVESVVFDVDNHIEKFAGKSFYLRNVNWIIIQITSQGYRELFNRVKIQFESQNITDDFRQFCLVIVVVSE